MVVRELRLAVADAARDVCWQLTRVAEPVSVLVRQFLGRQTRRCGISAPGERSGTVSRRLDSPIFGRFYR